MVAGFITRRRFPFKERDEKKEATFWEDHTGKAFLQSSVNDTDILTDWVYFNEIHQNTEDDIPQWLRTLQLVSCICGTISWAIIASDGRVMDWIRQLVMWIVFGFMYSLRVVFFLIPQIIADRLCNLIGGCCVSISRQLDDNLKWFDEAILQTQTLFQTGFHFPSGAVLFLGIVMEDIPQIILTFLIEEVITSDEAKGQISEVSGAAQLNLVLATFDIAHKLAEAYDSRNDMFRAGGDLLGTLSAHTGPISSLAGMGGSHFVSASWDKTLKLWETSTDKPIKTIEVHDDYVYDVAKLDETRIVSASRDRTCKIYDIKKGIVLKTIEHPGTVKCASASPTGECFLTGCGDGVIRLWTSSPSSDFEKMEEFHGIFSKGFVNHLAFLDESHFVATSAGSNTIRVVKVCGGDIVFEINVRCVAAMSSTTFLTSIGDSDYGIITLWSLDSGGRFIKLFRGHRKQARSLSKVDDARFVSGSDDKTAKLWDIPTGTCLHTYSGHTDSLLAVAYMSDESKLLTGSDLTENTIKIWKVEPTHTSHSDEHNGSGNSSAVGGEDEDATE